MTRHPHLRLELHSRHPLVWVSGVRHALRRAGAPRTEIERFSATALASPDPDRVRRVCTDWAEIALLPPDPSH